MNLRVQSGLAHSRLTLDAISVSTLPYYAGHADSVKLRFNPIPHRPAKPELRFQFPTGPSLGKECGPVRSVEASAKLAEICGFHQGWCINLREWNFGLYFCQTATKQPPAVGPSTCGGPTAFGRSAPERRRGINVGGKPAPDGPRSVVSHPRRKDKDAPRMRHPASVMI